MYLFWLTGGKCILKTVNNEKFFIFLLKANFVAMYKKSEFPVSFGHILGKKPGILIASSVIILFLLFISSCAKEDTIPPVLQLRYGNSLSQPLPTVPGTGTFTDPGYTASDNKDGNLNNMVHVFGSVNPNLKGIYTLTYSVKDAAGNVSTQTRTVNIFNDADSLAGVYTVIDSTVSPTIAMTSYAVTLSTDNTADSVIHFDRFAGLFNDSTVVGKNNRKAYTLTIPHQTVTFTPSSTPVTHSFTGSGIDSLGPLIQTVILLNYIDSDKTTVPYVVTKHHTRWTH